MVDPGGRLLVRFEFEGNPINKALFVTLAQLQLAGIGAGGLWSISRGLGRGLSDRGEYKRMLEHADSPRSGDLDGRGNLSLAALRAFVGWFLRVALDQIRFMGSLYDLEGLATRTQRLARLRTDHTVDHAVRAGYPRPGGSSVARDGLSHPRAERR
jgi:hypothetical protein